MGRVSGKIAIVTGAASGIGKASAIALANEGATVVATDVQAAASRDLVAYITSRGGNAIFLAHDVTSEEDWVGVVASTQRQFGALHVLVNNAGIAVLGNVTDIRLSDWRRQQAVNVDGVFLGAKHSLPLIRASGGGSIINISSVAGLRGSAGATAYCASKGAVRLFTKALAIECAAERDNVRVNSIHPGVIDTPIWTGASAALATGAMPGGANTPDLDAVAAVLTPIGKKGLPEDIAAGVVYLASDESRYATGSELVIDGGISAR